jgi:hypothetical protein
MHTNNILFPEEIGVRKSISTVDVAFKLTDEVLKYINQKMLEGFSVIELKLLTV